MTTHAKIPIAAALLLAVLLPLQASASGTCQVVGPLKPCLGWEAMVNGQFNGAPGAGNGFELLGAAETTVAEHASESGNVYDAAVNLATSGSSPDGNNALGLVRMTFNREVRLSLVDQIAYTYDMPTMAGGRQAFLQVYLMLDTNGDHVPDACLASDNRAALVQGGYAWNSVVLGPTSNWALVDSGCGVSPLGPIVTACGGAGVPGIDCTQLNFQPLAVQRVNAQAVVLRMYVQALGSGADPWPSAPVNVDDVSLVATVV